MTARLLAWAEEISLYTDGRPDAWRIGLNLHQTSRCKRKHVYLGSHLAHQRKATGVENWPPLMHLSKSWRMADFQGRSFKQVKSDKLISSEQLMAGTHALKCGMRVDVW